MFEKRVPKIIILIGDGDVNYVQTTIQQAVDNDVKIYTVNVGYSAASSELKQMADPNPTEHFGKVKKANTNKKIKKFKIVSSFSYIPINEGMDDNVKNNSKNELDVYNNRFKKKYKSINKQMQMKGDINSRGLAMQGAVTVGQVILKNARMRAFTGGEISSIAEADAWFSVGQCGAAMVGRCTCYGNKYNLSLKYYIEDYYDFYEKIPENGEIKRVGLCNNDEWVLISFWGKANPFISIGKYEINLSWKKGQRAENVLKKK